MHEDSERPRAGGVVKTGPPCCRHSLQATTHLPSTHNRTRPELLPHGLSRTVHWSPAEGTEVLELLFCDQKAEEGPQRPRGWRACYPDTGLCVLADTEWEGSGQKQKGPIPQEAQRDSEHEEGAGGSSGLAPSFCTASRTARWPGRRQPCTAISLLPSDTVDVGTGKAPGSKFKVTGR